MALLRLLSAGSTLHGLRSCAALAAQAIGCELAIATDHGHSIRDAALHGAAQADVVLLPADMIDALGDLARERVALGTVSIGGVVRAGAPEPAIGTMDELSAALVAAEAVLLTTAPTGDHLMKVILEMGLANALAPKLLRFGTSATLLAQLGRRRDNALGFSPETEIRAGDGVAFIGGVPDEIQIALPYAAAMLAATTQPDAGRAFLAFLATAPARAAFARSGVRQ